jgi:hypothetical protein
MATPEVVIDVWRCSMGGGGCSNFKRTLRSMKRHGLRFAVFMLFLGGAGACMAIETPAYRVELDTKPFQIRDYAPLLEATVHVSGTRDAAVSAGFRLLAHYIFGGNRTQTKLAMTAPVLQTPAEPRAFPKQGGVTAAVSSVSGWDVSFIMPQGYTRDTLPPATDPGIRFSEVPARRVAVISFSGFWTDGNLQEHQAQLLSFLARRHLTAISAPIYAFYDPPWTPWFWRTNEVHYLLSD